MLPHYQTIKIREDQRVGVITIPQGLSKPYVRRHNKREEIYIRVGSASQLATREQQARLFELGGMIHTELLPVPGSSFDCLDIVRVENYLRGFIQEPDIPKDEDSWKKRLERLGFLTLSGEMLYCSIAGMVLFGKTPRRYLKQAGIRVLAFDGINKEYNAKLDKVLDSPIVGRYENTGKLSDVIELGLIEQLIETIIPFISQDSNAIDESMRRKRTFDYPLDALRESFLNAIAHRDWTRNLEIEVGIYSDRLEVISPGALPNSMTVEKMIAGQRSPRNTTIVEVLRDYGFVDSRGMGVRRKILPMMIELNGNEPVFESNEDFLKTVLFK